MNNALKITFSNTLLRLFSANLKKLISDCLLVQKIFHIVLIHYQIEDFNKNF